MAAGPPAALAPPAARRGAHLDGHDLAVVAGAPVFRYYPWIPGDCLRGGLRLWHITDDPAEAASAPVGDSILGDPVLTIEQLLPLVPQGARSQPLKPPLPHRMSPLPQTSAAVNPAGLPTILKAFADVEDSPGAAYTSIGETIWPASRYWPPLVLPESIARTSARAAIPEPDRGTGRSVSSSLGSIAMSVPIAAGPEPVVPVWAVCLQGLVPTMNRQQRNRRTLGECHAWLSQHQ